MKHNLVFRPFEKGDEEIVSEIITENLVKDYSEYVDLQEYIKQYRPDGILKLATQQKIFVIEDENEVIGTGSILDKNELKTIYIRRDKQKIGVGRWLVENLEGEMKKNGELKAKLYAARSAGNFYEKLSYVATGKFSTIDPEEKEMEKAL